MACIVAVTGRSGSGKTSAIECALRELASMGVRVLAVKHTYHGVDVKGKDTWRFNEAGAVAVLALGPGEVAVFTRKLEPEALLEALSSFYDAVIVEGFRSAAEKYERVVDVEVLGPREACRAVISKILECTGSRGAPAQASG